MSGLAPLQQLSPSGTVVIADTADFENIPSEGTTNPSLLYQAAQDPRYASLVSSAIAYANSLPDETSRATRFSSAVDTLAVQFETEIYKLTRRVSTEVDVELSFNTAATVESALRVLKLYEAQGVSKSAVRIKISGTWEGIQAARSSRETMAIAASEAGVDAIAPYVGRIADWGRLHGDEDDLGVKRVAEIQNYLRKYGHKTQVMPASFSNTAQVRGLAGIDLLTASPAMLEALRGETEPLAAALTKESATASKLEQRSYLDNEAKFRWDFNEDELTVEKSADAMRRFGQDTVKLKEILSKMI